jgi:hypothetical protein
MKSDVTQFVVHQSRDESVRCTRQGSIKLLEAEVVLLVDEAQDYQECIKGRDRLEAIVQGGRAVPVRMLLVNVDSTTDDPERMVAAVTVVTEQNPTGRPPYCLPEAED